MGKKLSKIALVALFALGNFTILMAQADSVIQAEVLDSDSILAQKLYNSGIEKLSDKNYDGAIADFNEAIALVSDFEKAFYNRGITKFEMKDYKGAVADFDNSLASLPSTAKKDLELMFALKHDSIPREISVASIHFNV